MTIADDPECCAFDHICCLQEHDTPEKAMGAFCQAHSQPVYKSGTFKTTARVLRQLTSFYMFTGVVRWIDKDEGDGVDNVRYGPEFCEFIRINRLGTVVAGPARVNRTCHPEHVVRGWIWAPNEKRVREWWENYQRRDK